MYYIYILRCEDNSLYTGITNDLEKRMREHFYREKNCAKYTSSHKAKKIECIWETENKSYASKLEYHIKKDLTKLQKEKLITGEKELKDFFDDSVIEYNKYDKIPTGR